MDNKSRLLDILRQNARLSNAEIAAMTGESEEEVEKAKKQLEDED